MNSIYCLEQRSSILKARANAKECLGPSRLKLSAAIAFVSVI